MNGRSTLFWIFIYLCTGAHAAFSNDCQKIMQSFIDSNPEQKVRFATTPSASLTVIIKITTLK